MLKTKEAIKTWLDEMGIENYTINKNLTVDVNGSVTLSNKNLKKIPVQFGKVGGTFYCDNNQLTSLEGAPQKVGGTFYCDNNQLTSLNGAPQKVGGTFSCHSNQLTSLEGAPQEVGGTFYCGSNQLTSLNGAPQKVGESFYCDNNKLTSIPQSFSKIKNLYVFPNLNWNNVEWINKILGDTLTAEEVFAIDNIEHRRVAFERMDKIKMKALKDFKVVDEQIDSKGNQMRVLSFTIQNMKTPLKFYNCICPSSKREYFIGTDKDTCLEAKASCWGFGPGEKKYINEW